MMSHSASLLRAIFLEEEGEQHYVSSSTRRVCVRLDDKLLLSIKQQAGMLWVGIEVALSGLLFKLKLQNSSKV